MTSLRTNKKEDYRLLDALIGDRNKIMKNTIETGLFKIRHNKPKYIET